MVKRDFSCVGLSLFLYVIMYCTYFTEYTFIYFNYLFILFIYLVFQRSIRVDIELVIT